jgi:hypothetical protein
VFFLYILFKDNNHIETETTYMINQDDFFLLIPFDKHSNLLYVFLRFVHFSETISILQNYVVQLHVAPKIIHILTPTI